MRGQAYSTTFFSTQRDFSHSTPCSIPHTATTIPSALKGAKTRQIRRLVESLPFPFALSLVLVIFLLALAFVILLLSSITFAFLLAFGFVLFSVSSIRFASFASFVSTVFTSVLAVSVAIFSNVLDTLHRFRLSLAFGGIFGDEGDRLGKADMEVTGGVVAKVDHDFVGGGGKRAKGWGELETTGHFPDRLLEARHPTYGKCVPIHSRLGARFHIIDRHTVAVAAIVAVTSGHVVKAERSS